MLGIIHPNKRFRMTGWRWGGGIYFNYFIYSGLALRCVYCGGQKVLSGELNIEATNTLYTSILPLLFLMRRLFLDLHSGVTSRLETGLCLMLIYCLKRSRHPA